jgi:hypothetical protein
MKDPENDNPKFRPDLTLSQACVVGKSYESGDAGFNTFIREM